MVDDGDAVQKALDLTIQFLVLLHGVEDHELLPADAPNGVVKRRTQLELQHLKADFRRFLHGKLHGRQIKAVLHREVQGFQTVESRFPVGIGRFQ